MNYLNNPYEIACLLKKATNKFVLYVSWNIEDDDCEEIQKAAPYLKRENILSNYYTYILCNSSDELNELFNMTVGDDGPTKLNSYAGKARVFACSSEGHENT